MSLQSLSRARWRKTYSLLLSRASCREYVFLDNWSRDEVESLILQVKELIPKLAEAGSQAYLSALRERLDKKAEAIGLFRKPPSSWEEDATTLAKRIALEWVGAVVSGQIPVAFLAVEKWPQREHDDWFSRLRQTCPGMNQQLQAHYTEKLWELIDEYKKQGFP